MDLSKEALRASEKRQQTSVSAPWGNEEAQNSLMLHPCLAELWTPEGFEQETSSLSVEEFLMLSGGVPSDVDKREQDRRARIHCMEEDDAVF